MPVESEDNIREAIAAIKDGTAGGLKDTVEKGEQQVDEGFDGGEDAMGRPWEPLSQETIRRKGHDDILIDSGEMRDSFQSDVDRGAMEARLGSNDRKLVYHEYGTEHIPRRPVLGPAAEYMATEVLEDAFTSSIEKQLLSVGIRF